MGEQSFPASQTKHDAYFGNVEIFRDYLELEIILQRQDPKLNTLTLEVTFQGCAGVGICYMLIQKTISLDLLDESFNWWRITSRLVQYTPFIYEKNCIVASLNSIGIKNYGT